MFDIIKAPTADKLRAYVSIGFVYSFICLLLSPIITVDYFALLSIALLFFMLLIQPLICPNQAGKIQHCHYDDIVDDRAKGDICGYPLCSSALDPVLTRSQYSINTKTGAIVDITELKVGSQVIVIGNNIVHCSIFHFKE